LNDIYVTGTFNVARPQQEFIRAHDGTLAAKTVRFEGIRENMLAALGGFRLEIPTQMRAALLNTAKDNTSSHGHYSTCYVPELVDLVSKHERWLIETIGYSF
jgi:hypothetical protein